VANTVDNRGILAGRASSQSRTRCAIVEAIRLGKVSQRTADGIKYRVEQLVERLTYKQPMERDLAKWVAELDPRMAK
jgi:hypothetical protein